MEVKIEYLEDICIVNAIGDCDASSSIFLDEGINNCIDSDAKKILVNCEQLDYISSAGIGVFTSKLEIIGELKKQIVLYSVKDSVLSVFTILGLDQLLPIVNTFEEAKSY